MVSSNTDPAQVASMAASVSPNAILRSVTRIDRPEQDFSLYDFIIPPSPLVIPGAKLLSLVGVEEGNARVAVEGTNAGYLTYGPYAMLSPGRYEITLKYSADGDTGSWDITAMGTVLAKGSIPNTSGATMDVVTTIDLLKDTQNFEVRAFYSGHGRLAIESLSIKPLSAAPAAH